MKFETLRSHFKALRSTEFQQASISRLTCFGSRGPGVQIPRPDHSKP